MHPITQIGVGLFLLLATLGLHLYAIQRIFLHIDSAVDALPSDHPHAHDVGFMLGVVFALSLVTLLEASVWGAIFVGLELQGEFWSAFYFSIVTLTTLGYGDIVLSAEARLLAALCALTGLFVMGLSTAFLIELFGRLGKTHKR